MNHLTSSMTWNRTRCKHSSCDHKLAKILIFFFNSENMKGLALQIYFSIYLWNYHKQVGLITSPINMLYAASLWKTMLSRMAIVDSCSVPMSNDWHHFFLERRTKVKDSIFWFKLRSNAGFFGMYGRVTVNKVIDGQKLRSMVNELTVTRDFWS